MGLSSLSRKIRSCRSRRKIRSALFYLQFGLQALVHFLPQGILALVGAFALGRAALLSARRRPVSALVFVGTIPLLVLHAVLTLIDPGELPFWSVALPFLLLQELYG